MSQSDKKPYQIEKVPTERPTPALVFGLVFLYFGGQFAFTPVLSENKTNGVIVFATVLLLVVGLVMLISWATGGSKKQLVAHDTKTEQPGTDA